MIPPKTDTAAMGRSRPLRRLRPRSFRTQIVVSTMTLMTLLVTGVGLVLLVLLELTAQHEVDTALADRTADVVEAVDRASATGLVVPPGALDPGELVYGTDGRLISGTVERRASATAAELSRSTTRRQADVAGDLRLEATPTVTPSGVGAVVVVSQETTPYERSEQYALVAILALGILAIGSTGLIARRVTGQALRPVRRMAATASEWSETDLARRFGLGPPHNEITALGETLDHLLERVARAIRSEQRLTAELAHELRTPLTAVQGSAELALMRDDATAETRADLEQVLASSEAMGETIRTLLDLARELADASSDTCAVTDVVDRVRELVPASLHLDAPVSTARCAAPVGLAVRALAPVVDNAARFARTRVSVTVLEDGETVALVVRDDGPGIDDAVAATLFEPGVSGSGGTGLGLAIARRVARTLGGDVDLADGGVRLRLPAP